MAPQYHLANATSQDQLEFIFIVIAGPFFELECLLPKRLLPYWDNAEMAVLSGTSVSSLASIVPSGDLPRLDPSAAHGDLASGGEVSQHPL